MKKRKPTMSADEFRGALESLNLTHKEAALLLDVSSRQRITAWASGKRPVPRYVAAFVRYIMETEGVKL